MKKRHTALAGLALVTAMAAPLALGADVSQGVQTLDLSSGSALFRHDFAAGGAGDTFSDRYNFTATSGSALAAVLTSLNLGNFGFGGAQINSFTVYNTAGFSLPGARQSAPGDAVEVWAASAQHLATDGFYLLISGAVRNDFAGNYSGTLSTTPVPEPATYAMLLGGAGLLGWIGRRRKG